MDKNKTAVIQLGRNATLRFITQASVYWSIRCWLKKKYSIISDGYRNHSRD